MMHRALSILLLAPALQACVAQPVGPAAAAPEASGWRETATESDRARLRGWRSDWVKALAQARATGSAADVAAQGALLDPDAGLAPVSLASGDYACRTIKLGFPDASPGLPYVAYPAFRCRIEAAGAGGFLFTKTSGSQRPVGRIFPDTTARMVFLGTLQLGDELGTLRYGHDDTRDLVALVERVGERRWRMVFPSPHFESRLDVIELVPAS